MSKDDWLNYKPTIGSSESEQQSNNAAPQADTEAKGSVGSGSPAVAAPSEKDCADLLGEAVMLMLQSGDADCREFAQGIPVEFKTRDGAPRAVVAVSARPAMPEEISEWVAHMDLHLTEHDDRHRLMAYKAAWPHISAWLRGVARTASEKGRAR